MAIEDVLPIIQATLAPMFLITGAGIYLNFIQGRLFRAVDRVQNLHTGDSEGDPEREIPYQLDRIRLIRTAIATGTVTMGLTAATAVFTILAFYLRRDMDAFILTSFGGALFFLGVSLLFGLIDTYRSMRIMHRFPWLGEDEVDRFEGD